jgi:homoserine kinase type II
MKLDAESQFTPTKQNITGILSAYDIALTTYRSAKTGIENCTMHITSGQERYVLRVYRQNKKSDAAILSELKFIDYLLHNCIPTIPAITNKSGQTITHVRSKDLTWQAILMRYAQGTHAIHYSDVLLQNLANIQAHMHNLADAYDSSGDKLDTITELRETIFIKLIKNQHLLGSRYQAFIDHSKNYASKLDPLLPTGLCHLDYDNGNVLSKNGKITAVLDFDDLSYAPYVMCLAYTLWDVLFDTKLAKVKDYVVYYQKIRTLNTAEKAQLIPIILFRNYVIGCAQIAAGNMSDVLLKKYTEIEHQLLELASTDWADK